MKNVTTDIYHFIDEAFISKFNELQSSFMKNYYYTCYKTYCMKNKRMPLQENEFFTNMRRRKVKLIQVCCPYCGNMNIIVAEGSLSKVEKFNYCTYCGRCSASKNTFFHISRYARIQYFHSSGLKALREQNNNIDDLKIMSYDIYHLELIELTSILEVLLRDFFVSFVYLNYNNSRSDYLNSTIHKTIGNDFMNIEKANNHYKKAIKLDLRTLITNECWESLIDVVQIRNTLVHNNGMIDTRFKNSKTFLRINNLIKGDLIFLDSEIIHSYFNYLNELLSAITNTFSIQYQNELHSLIANYYFNSVPEMISNSNWVSLKKLIIEAQLESKND